MRIQQLQPQYAPVKKGELEYYRIGQGSPILLISGYANDISSWDKEFIADLAQQHELIIFNNRNVGCSIINSRVYNTDALADDTAQLIQALGLKKPAILGISMGGMIAQQIAVHHPDQISSLILINTAIAGNQFVYPDAEVTEQIINMPKNKIGRYFSALNLFFPPGWRMKMATKLITDRFQPQTYHEIDLFNLALVSGQQHLLFDWAKDNHTAKKIAQLNVPVLILNGGSDIVIPPVNSDILTRTIPNAQLVRWEDGGHALIYQYPQEMTDEINIFMQEASA